MVTLRKGSDVLKKRYLYLLLLPGVLFLTIFLVIPILSMMGTTFNEGGSFSLQGYIDFLRINTLSISFLLLYALVYSQLLFVF